MAVLSPTLLQNDVAEFTKLIPALKRQIQEGIAVVRKIREKFADSDVNTASVSALKPWICRLID